MTPPRGRPRDEATDARILAVATRHLLARGYHGLSIDTIAAESDTAKTTVYRRWPTKDHLAIAVVAHIQDEVPITDTGDLLVDLTGYLRAIAIGLDTVRRAGRAADDRSGGTVAELVAATARHPDLGTASRAQFAHRNAQATALIQHAIDDGRLAEVDPALLFDQLAGAVYYRVLVTGEPVDAGFAARLVSQALQGLLPSDDKDRS